MPSKIIRDDSIVDDHWIVVDSDAESLPEGNLIVPQALWSSRRGELESRSPLGVWLNSDEPPQLIAEDLNRFDVIAINFPAFADGRGFSYARELRQERGYEGELRAIGAFMRDQLYFLKRCGFNAFALDYSNLDAALESFNDFSNCYQASADCDQPLFRRR